MCKARTCLLFLWPNLLILWVWGHTQWYSAVTPDSALRNWSLQAQGPLGMLGIESASVSGCPKMRQMPYHCAIAPAPYLYFLFPLLPILFIVPVLICVLFIVITVVFTGCFGFWSHPHWYSEIAPILCSGITTGSTAIGCQGSNLGQLPARQAPYLLY